MDIRCVYCEVGAEFLNVFWRLQCFKALCHGSAVIHLSVTVEAGQVLLRELQFSSVSIIPLVLHTELHPNTAVIWRTSGQSLGTLKLTDALLDIRACGTRMFFNLVYSVKSLMYFEIIFLECGVLWILIESCGIYGNFLNCRSYIQSAFNPLAYTDVCETAGLARSINTQPAVRRNSETNPTSQHNRGMYWSQ